MRALGAQSTRTALALSIRVIRASIISRLRCVSGAAVGFERFERAGERGIVRAREKAEKTLGPKFNTRAFHDAVLELGSVPLPVVTARIDRFITEDGKGPYPDME